MSAQWNGRQSLRECFDEGVRQRADYMVIAVDAFNGEPFPVYITAPETTSTVVEELRKENNRAAEIYDLRSDLRSQIGFRSRVWNNETKRAEMEQAITAAAADFPSPAAESIADQMRRAHVHPAARAANARERPAPGLQRHGTAFPSSADRDARRRAGHRRAGRYPEELGLRPVPGVGGRLSHLPKRSELP